MWRRFVNFLSRKQGPAEPKEISVSQSELSYDWKLKERNSDMGMKDLSLEQSRFEKLLPLIKISEQKFLDNADPAQLALIVGSAHLQAGDLEQARFFMSKAQDWGCSKSDLARALIAATHHTLGNAAELCGQIPKSEDHFKKSHHLKGGQEFINLKMEKKKTPSLTSVAKSSTISGLPEKDNNQGNDQPKLDVQGCDEERRNPLLSDERIFRRDNEILKALEQQKITVDLLRSEIVSVFQKETANMTRQLEAFLSLQSFLNGQVRVPEIHGWPVSPDLGIFLVDLIEKNNYNIVIEFGSGTSTALIALAMQRANQRWGNLWQPRQVTFEHLQAYHDKTTIELELLELQDKVDLVLSPLTKYRSPTGEEFSYYDCRDFLKKLSVEGISSEKILVFVDGPPGATGIHARYPALPIVLESFPASHIDILLDDYIRQDEKEVVEKWRSDLASKNYNFTITQKKMEKNACLISILGRSGNARI